MTVLFNSIAFVPNLVIRLAGTADILAQVEQEVGKIKEDKITPRLKKFLQELNLRLKGTSKDEIRKHIFALANKAYLEGKTKLAFLLISAVHKKVSGYKAAVLQKNFSFTKRLLEGTPYNHGYLDQDGRLVLREDLRRERQKKGLAIDTVLGLNCMTMNNILVNLIIGARGYTPHLADPDQKGEVKKGTTGEDIFTKKELIEEGVYSYPVIVNFPASSINKLSGLLRLYGDYFSAQLYSTIDGKPFHAVFVFRKGKEYRVLDTLFKGGVFRETGDLNSLSERYGAFLNYSFNLVDSSKARAVEGGKDSRFIRELKGSISQAKSEFSNVVAR